MYFDNKKAMLHTFNDPVIVTCTTRKDNLTKACEKGPLIVQVLFVLGEDQIVLFISFFQAFSLF